MGKLIKGTVLGAIIVYIWMMVSWMALPWHCSVMHNFANSDQVSTAIMQNTTKNGIYLLPGMCSKENGEEQAAAMKKGPIIFASVQRTGIDPYSPSLYIKAFVIFFISALLVTSLFLLANIKHYLKGVVFVTLIGLTIGVFGELPNWNWWGSPLDYVGVEILDCVIAWFLAGLGISAVARRA